MKLYRLNIGLFWTAVFGPYKHAGVNHGAFSNIPDSWRHTPAV